MTTFMLTNKTKTPILTLNDRNSVNNIILFTNARDEKNIKEWVAHHLLLGFDLIYIFDHKSIKPLSVELKCFKKTSTFDVKKSTIGSVYSRMYICYKNVLDKNSTVFIVIVIDFD
jgi:hypothetical protein